MRLLEDIRKILILRPDGIGDAINSTPAIANLKDAYPDAHISVVVRPPGAEILNLNPYIDEIIVYDAESLREKLHFCENLRLEGYDLAVTLRNMLECNLMTYLSGARYRVGWKYPLRKLSLFLTHRYDQNDPKGVKHEIDRNMDVVRLIGVKGNKRELILCLSEEERIWASNFLNSEEPDNNVPIVGIHPGGSTDDKLWPAENYAHIANQLGQKLNVQIMLFSGPNEADLAQGIQNMMTIPPIPASGLSLRQFSALLEKCSLFICNDSGPMHIAAALKVPTIAIFGSTDYVRWRPYNEKAIVVKRDMDCWPCSAHKCNKNFECIKSLPVSEVWNAVIRQFEAGTEK